MTCQSLQMVEWFLGWTLFHCSRVVEILSQTLSAQLPTWFATKPTNKKHTSNIIVCCFSSPPSSWPLIPPSSLVGMSSSSDVLRWPQSFSTALPDSWTFAARAVSAFLQPCSASVPYIKKATFERWPIKWCRKHILRRYIIYSKVGKGFVKWYHSFWVHPRTTVRKGWFTEVLQKKQHPRFLVCYPPEN